MNTLKYDNIVYPFFAFRKKPAKVIYDLDTIKIQLHNGDIKTIDDKKLEGKCHY